MRIVKNCRSNEQFKGRGCWAMDHNSRLYKVSAGILNGIFELELSDFDRPGVYGLIVNEDDYLYIGKSNTSMFKRIWDHIGNLSIKSELFGLLPSELKSGKVRISIVIIYDDFNEEISLSEKEIYYINKYEPILQKQPNSDRCIRGTENRRAAVEERLHIF